MSQGNRPTSSLLSEERANSTGSLDFPALYRRRSILGIQDRFNLTAAICQVYARNSVLHARQCVINPLGQIHEGRPADSAEVRPARRAAAEGRIVARNDDDGSLGTGFLGIEFVLEMVEVTALQLPPQYIDRRLLLLQLAPQSVLHIVQ